MTDPVDPWEDGKGFEGRHLRATVGTALLLAVGFLVSLQVWKMIHTGEPIQLPKELLLLYAVMAGTGLLLTDKKTLFELLDRLPFPRKSP